ncbi:uncharacterized protein VTP21DRAFT_4482 [Calcarisporiella thermophila]|uniref:uncharacterized protein n=1 Tax=Calcarisporiella thermophila TaxID=911321 RepID=UPI0037425D43
MDLHSPTRSDASDRDADNKKEFTEEHLEEVSRNIQRLERFLQKKDLNVITTPGMDSELVKKVSQHLAQDVGPFSGSKEPLSTSVAIPPDPSIDGNDSEDAFAGPSDATRTAYDLQGADVVNDIYKWHQTHTPLKQDSNIRSKSFYIPRNHEHSDALANLNQPGGFRRFFLYNQARQSGLSFAPKTKHFIEFLAVSQLYDLFAGEDLEDTEEDSTTTTTDEISSTLPSSVTTEETPLLIRRISRKNLDEDHGKASYGKTVFMLFKAFIASGILFLPKAFKNGGIVFSTVAMVVVAILSTWSFLLLVECRKVVPGGYGEIGGHLYGSWAKWAVLFSIASSQLGFVCGFLVFIAENLQEVILSITSQRLYVEEGALIVVAMLILMGLSLIRKLQRLSWAAIFSDTLIITGLSYLYIYTSSKIITEGIAPGILTFNPKSFGIFIGTSVFSYEGIGLIIPIHQTMRDPSKFPRALVTVITCVCILLIASGGLGYLAFGEDVQTIVLHNLNPGPGKDIVQLLYVIAVMLTAPLALFPATRIIETGIFHTRSGRHNPRIKWLKNAGRIGVVSCVAWVAYSCAPHLDLFISFLGSFACVPLSLIYPPLFHLKAIANTTLTKSLDVFLIFIGICTMIFTMSVTLSTWN